MPMFMHGCDRHRLLALHHCAVSAAVAGEARALEAIKDVRAGALGMARVSGCGVAVVESVVLLTVHACVPTSARALKVAEKVHARATIGASNSAVGSGSCLAVGD